MSSLMPRLLLLSCLLAGNAGAQQGGITVYRCTDAKGKVALQDAPCGKGAAQQTRSMQLLKDPPAKPVAMPAAMTPAVAAPGSVPPPVIIVRTPQPLYECVRPDNSTYTSDTGEGNPRWMSIWALDDLGSVYATTPRAGINVTSGGSSLTNSGNSTQSGSGIGYPPHRPHPPRPPRPGFGYGAASAGIWVRDQCHALPQAEVCSRLHDRRDDIRRRFFNAQEKERATLNTEERGINARLDADCGGH